MVSEGASWLGCQPMRKGESNWSGGGPIVLGINAAHDAAACVMIGGEPRAAVAEERLSRRKHQAGPPRRAIESCLSATGMDHLADVDCIVVNQFPQTDFAGDLRREGYRGELLINPSHHLLHAHYAAAASGQSDSAVLVVDGSGYSYAEHRRRGSPLLGPPPRFPDMMESQSSFALREGELEFVEREWGLWDANTPYFRFPSLGHMFSAASQYIFGKWVHAGKTMGLAPYGDASRLAEPIVTYSDDGLSIDTEWILRLPPRSKDPAHLDEICRDVAAKVQVELERAILFLARRLSEATGLRHLSLSGGVALNSVANGRLRTEGPFAETFATPAAGDSGTAVGAAVYGHAHLTGGIPRWSSYSDFLGPEHGSIAAEHAIERTADQANSNIPIDPATTAAEDIATGRIVGWHEGRSELGPRALGHRSILCDPSVPTIRDDLNERVKFREPFRPYAAAVLEEHAHRYFEIDWADPFMLSVVRIRSEHRESLPGICHVDGTCRTQTVPPGAGGFRRLIEAFFSRTGLPLVLNTSLNIRGEPIVETPDDSLRCFLGSDIDVLYLEGRRLEKLAFDPAAPNLGLIPVANAGIALEQRNEWQTDGWSGSELVARRPTTGQAIALKQIEAEVLLRMDGEMSVEEIIADSEVGSKSQIIIALASLLTKGLISMAGASSHQATQFEPRAL